jgi:transcriptional regulator with XRE-family HTH domain
MKTNKAFKFQPIGFLIREIRLRQRRKARDVAKQIGIDPRALNAIEKGRIRNPSIDRLAEIADALGMSLTQLLTLYEGKKPGRFAEGNSIGEFTMSYGKNGFRKQSVYHSQ